jgi:hypothetical protein
MAEKIENVVLSVGLYCSFFRDKPYVMGRGVALGQATRPWPLICRVLGSVAGGFK